MIECHGGGGQCRTPSSCASDERLLCRAVILPATDPGRERQAAEPTGACSHFPCWRLRKAPPQGPQTMLHSRTSSDLQINLADILHTYQRPVWPRASSICIQQIIQHYLSLSPPLPLAHSHLGSPPPPITLCPFASLPPVAGVWRAGGWARPPGRLDLINLSPGALPPPAHASFILTK